MDGRDDAGNVLPAGNYTWKILGTPGFGVEYVTSPGSNYPTANTSFVDIAPGCHVGPATIAVDSTGFYVGAGSENIDATVAKQSLTGTTRNWVAGNTTAFSMPIAFGLAGTTLFNLYPSGNVYHMDTNTGEYASTWPNPPISATYGGENPTDMTATATALVFSYPTAGVVRWLDYSGAQTRIVSVAGAKSVDLAADGTAFVISGTTLCKITSTGTSATTIVSSGLTAPRRAAVNQTNGEIYVVDCAQWLGGQIKRYSSAGALLQTYGVTGGRPFGLYATQKTNFRGVSDIAVEADGKFWIAEGEAAPRRTARFNKSGTLVNEWYGGQAWAPCFAPEPDNPGYVWVSSQWGSFMRCAVNYTSKTWSVHSTYIYEGSADGLIGGHYNSEGWTSRIHNGELYLCREPNLTVMKVDRTNWKLIPMTVAEGYMQLHYGDLPAWLKTLYDADPTNRQSMLWRDENGDGRPLNSDGTPQMNELHFSTLQAPYTHWQGLDHDFNYTMYSGDAEKVKRWTLTGWNAIGAPIYGDFPTGVDLADKPSRQGGGQDGRWSSHVTADPDGNIWGVFNPNITAWGTSSDAFVARWNPNGTLAWQSGRQNTGKPGSLGTTRHIYGTISNGTGSNNLVVGRFSNEWPSEGPTPVYVYDQDGLYAGLLLGKPVNQGTTPNWRYGLGAEGLTGQIMKHTDGKVYFFGQWINEGRIYKITGWDGWQRASGTVAVPVAYTNPAFTAEVSGPSSTGTGLYAQFWDNTTFTGTPVVTRNDAAPANAGIDFTYNQANTTTNSPTGTPFWTGRWTGTIIPRRTGWHMFQQNAGYGSFQHIWVNNVLVSTSTPFGWNSTAGRVSWLTAGTAYPVKVEYVAWDAGPSLHAVKFEWSEPETNCGFANVPTSQLNPTDLNTGTGLKAQYYNGTAFNSLIATRTDPTINFDWGAGSPATSVDSDNFSVRWTGKVMPTYSETYTFTSTTDEGVKVWVNNVLVINKWVNQTATAWSGNIALQAGQQYDIKVEYFEASGNASAKLEWKSASQAKQVIPQTSLFPAP